MLLNVDILLGRDDPGDPEHLLLLPDGVFPSLPGISADVCDPLTWEPIDRARLHAQATTLLEAAGTSL